MPDISAPRRRHALHGALLLTALVSPAIIGLLILSGTHHRPELAEGAFRLTVLALASGAVGGAVWGATVGMHDAGAIRRAASWWLASGAAAALLVGSARIFIEPLLARGSIAALYLLSLTGWNGIALLALGVLVFGLAMADATIPANASRQFERRLPTSVLGMLAALVIIVWARSDLAPGTTHRIFVTTEADAKRVLASVTADAKANPDDGEAQLAYGLALTNLDRYSEAIPVLERAEHLLPDNGYPSNALGWVLNQQREYGKAVPHLQNAVRIDPDYEEAWHSLGWALLNLNRITEARKAYATAVRLAPGDAKLANEYAWTLFRDRDTERAIVQVFRSIKLDPNVAGSHANAGYMLRSKTRFPEARAQFERALQLEPNAPGVWVQLGATDYLGGDARGADTAFATAYREDSLSIRPGSAERRMWDAARHGNAAMARSVFVTPLSHAHATRDKP